MELSRNTLADIQSEVQSAFDGLVDAFRLLDSGRYIENFDKEKFSGLNADGTVWHSIKDLEDVIDAGFSSIEKINSLDFCNVKITVIDKTTAILVNEFEQGLLLKSGDLVRQAGGGAQVWSKSNGNWKLVSVSASNQPQ